MLEKSDIVCFAASSKPDEARAFYGEVLGLESVEETPFAMVFRSNGVVLRVQKVERVHAAPYTLIGWEVVDIDATVARLSDRGVVFERFEWIEQDEAGIWTVPDGTKVAWFKDPDSNLLSLSQVPRAA